MGFNRYVSNDVVLSQDVIMNKINHINEDDTVAVPKDKMVKIRPRESHRCTIGGVTYDLKKDVVTTVPEFVKSVLLKADLLQSL